MGIQRVGLEHHAHATFSGRNIVHAGFTDEQITAGDGFETRDHTQQRRFAAAGWPDKHHELPFLDIEVDIF